MVTKPHTALLMSLCSGVFRFRTMTEANGHSGFDWDNAHTKRYTKTSTHIFIRDYTLREDHVLFYFKQRKQDESVDTVMSEWQKGEIKGKYYTVLYFLQMMVWIMLWNVNDSTVWSMPFRKLKEGVRMTKLTLTNKFFSIQWLPVNVH